MARDNSIQISSDPELLKLSRPDLKAAEIVKEQMENIERFITEGQVRKGTTGSVFFWVGPVSIGPMEELTGWNNYATFNIVSMAYAPQKWGGMMALTDEAQFQTQGNLMAMSTRLLAASGSRLREQLASDVLGGFTDTVGDYTQPLNYDDVTNELIQMSEGYDERWIFGEPESLMATGIMTRSALKGMRIASVGGTGITGSNTMWGGEPLPMGPAGDVYKNLFSMSDPAEGVNFYRGPKITTFPVNAAGVVQSALGSNDGGMNGALFHKDGIFMAVKGREEMRTVRATFNTIDFIQLHFYRAYAIGINERGVTLKSKVQGPKARTIS